MAEVILSSATNHAPSRRRTTGPGAARVSRHSRGVPPLPRAVFEHYNALTRQVTTQQCRAPLPEWGSSGWASWQGDGCDSDSTQNGARLTSRVDAHIHAWTLFVVARPWYERVPCAGTTSVVFVHSTWVEWLC